MRIDGGTKASAGQQADSRFEQVMSRELSRSSAGKTPTESNIRFGLTATSKKKAPGSQRVGVNFKAPQAGKVLKGMQEATRNTFTKAMALTTQSAKTAIATFGKTVDSMMSKAEAFKDGAMTKAFGKDGATGKAMGDASGRSGAGQEIGTAKQPGEAASTRSPDTGTGPKNGVSDGSPSTTRDSKNSGKTSETTGETSPTKTSARDGATGKTTGDATGKDGTGSATGTGTGTGRQSGDAPSTAITGQQNGAAGSAGEKSKTTGSSEKTGDASPTKTSGKDGAGERTGASKQSGDTPSARVSGTDGEKSKAVGSSDKFGETSPTKTSGKDGAGERTGASKQSGDTPSARVSSADGEKSKAAGSSDKFGEASPTKTTGKDGAGERTGASKQSGDAPTTPSSSLKGEKSNATRATTEKPGDPSATKSKDGKPGDARSAMPGTGSQNSPASTPESKAASLESAARSVLSKAMPLTARTAIATFGTRVDMLMTKAQTTLGGGVMTGALGKDSAAGKATGDASGKSESAAPSSQTAESAPGRSSATGNGPQNTPGPSSQTALPPGARTDGPAIATGTERATAAPASSDAGTLATTNTGTPVEGFGSQEGRAALALQDTPMTQEGFLLLSPGLQGVARRAKANGSSLSMVYMLGPNPQGAEFVSITTDDKGFITGPTIDIALTEGTVDTEGNWVALAGEGMLEGTKVTLEPDADGCAFVTDGVDGVPSKVTAWVKGGEAIRADVMSVRKLE